MTIFVDLVVGLAVTGLSKTCLATKMIRCHLSRLMGERKMNIADVARETGLHRNTITLLYKETATRVDLDTISELCRLFVCSVGDLFEYVE